MRKRVKQIGAILLVATLAISCVQGFTVSAGTAAAVDENTGYTTRTWDFDNAGDADDFTFFTTDYYGETEFQITGGQLNSGCENLNTAHEKRFDVHKKALLKDSYGGRINKLSVDVSPVENSGVIDACVYLGVNPGASGTISATAGRTSDGIMFRYRDVGINDSYQEIIVELCHDNTRYPVLEVKDNSTNGNQITALDAGNAAASVTMTVEITGGQTTLTIALKEDSSKSVKYTIDMLHNTSGADTGFQSSMLEGQVGVGAWYRGACFDNLSILSNTYDLLEFDFETGTQADSFKFYEHAKGNGNGAMKITDGCLCSTTMSDITDNGYNRKVILNNGYASVQSAAVDFVPAENATGMKGCMYFDVLGGPGSTNGTEEINISRKEPTVMYTGINGMVFKLRDGDQWDKHAIELNVEYIYEKCTYTIATSTFTPNWYRANGNAEALTMVVEKITDDLYLCTIAQKSNPNNYVQKQIDLSDFSYTKDSVTTQLTEVLPDYDKSGTVGLGTWGYRNGNATPVQFDNLIVNGVPVTVGGMKNSGTIVSKYRSLPTGADVVDGKYILGWTMNTALSDGTSVKSRTDTYYGTQDGNLTYTYEANVVDPDMLEVTWQRGSAANGSETCCDVRFAACLNDFDYDDYKNAGFVFSKTVSGDDLIVDAAACITRRTTLLYQSLNAGDETVTPNDVYPSDNGYPEYFIARAITNIPIGSSIHVRAFLELSNGDILYGQSKTVTVQ